MKLKYFDLTFELISRDFYGRYKGSLGGAFWAFIEPLFLLSIYSFAFGFILKSKWGSDSLNVGDYSLKIFSGLIVFNALAECINRSSICILQNKNFVKKINFPLAILPLVTAITAMIHASISVFIWYLGDFILNGNIEIKSLFFPCIYLLIFPIILGISYIFSSLGVFIKDLSQINFMVTQSLLFISPIFYSLNMVPDKFRNILLFNPLTYIIEAMRSVLFFGELPGFSSYCLYLFFACVFALFGFLFFWVTKKQFSDLL